VSRFATRTLAALLVLAAAAAYPVVYRHMEHRHQLAPFQGERLLLVGRAGADSVVPDPFDRRLRVTGDRIEDTRTGLPTPGHLAIGAVDGRRVVLTLRRDDGRSYWPWRVPYRVDGDTLHVQGRDILWWDHPRDLGLYGGGLHLRRVTGSPAASAWD
jgi:hypothetical protein